VKRLLGVDIGGTGIKLGAVQVDGRPRITGQDLIEGHAGRPPAEVLPEVAERLGRLTRDAGWDRADGVGVGSAGLIRRDSGEIAYSPNLPAWTGAPLRSLLAGALSLPVAVDNDVNAFALAEWWWGAGQGALDAVFLTIGTGIGGALVADGRLVRGASGFAGEPGHMTLVLDGIPCPCGNHGCAERYVGTDGLVEAARAHPGFRADPALAAADPLTPKIISDAAKQESAVARDVLSDAGRALGGLLVSLVNLTNPEVIVVGGGVSQAGPLLLDPARDHLRRYSLVARHSAPRVLPAALGEPAGLLGAAALVLAGDFGPK
jgi:glucokinase